MAGRVIAQLSDGRRLVRATAAGPGAGVASVSLDLSPDVRVVDEVLAVHVTGGYTARWSVSGSVVTVTPQYYDYPASAAGPAIDVPATDDLSAQTVTVIAIGH